MRLEKISTAQFRNLEPGTIECSPGANVFTGPNGHGKTNILEAIHFFKFGRSFRTSSDTDLIRFEEQFFRIVAAVVYDDGERSELSATVDEYGAKRLKQNTQEISRLTDLVGNYPSVLFGPQDLRIINGYPAERRRFLDMAGSMVGRSYLDDARRYQRVLQQRNAALKTGCTRDELRAWNDELVGVGSALIRHRKQAAGELCFFVAEYAGTVFGSDRVELQYACAVEHDGDPADCFAVQLASLENEERRRKTTLAGPHKDDLVVTLGGNDIKRFGSQGQKRLCAVLLRLAEMRFLEKHLKERCLLLLDDLFSELDEEHGAKLMEVLRDRNQIFVTSPVPLVWRRAGETRAFRLQEGKVFL